MKATFWTKVRRVRFSAKNTGIFLKISWFFFTSAPISHDRDQIWGSWFRRFYEAYVGYVLG